MSAWTADERLADALLARFVGRLPDTRAFALRHRVLLLRASDGKHLDVALGAIPLTARTPSASPHVTASSTRHRYAISSSGSVPGGTVRAASARRDAR